jgi:hypothetical protein
MSGTNKMVRIIYLFIDGIGIGSNNPDINPFARYSKNYFRCLANLPAVSEYPMFLAETDAQMGIPGLPQSATGQTSIWTGLNGPRIMGHHMTGFPGPTLVRVIHEYSILKIFVEQQKRGTLLNTYTLDYFERIIRNPRYASASTHVQLASGQAPLTIEDLRDGRGIYMDITNEFIGQIHPEQAGLFPIIPARQRGVDLVRMAEPYDIVLFEYFLTDKAGHDCNFPLAAKTIRTVESFVEGILSAMDFSNTLLLIASDHGNLENLSTKSHTDNPVMTFAWGKSAERMPTMVRELKDIPRFIYDTCGMSVELDNTTASFQNPSS